MRACPQWPCLALLFSFLWMSGQTSKVVPKDSLRIPDSKMAKFGDTFVAKITRTDTQRCLPYFSAPSTDPPARKKLKRDDNPSLIPEGADFDRLITESCAIVDKTLLIVDFMEGGKKVQTIHYPPGRGKSVALGSIDLFLSIQLDSREEIMADITATPSYRLFVDGETPNGGRLEPRFSIATHTSFIKANLGKWPVIHLDLGNTGDTTFAAILENMKSALSELYGRHDYLLSYMEKVEGDLQLHQRTERRNMKEWKKSFETMLENNGQGASRVQITKAIGMLVDVTRMRFGKDVVVLLDNYDAPLNNILQHGTKSDIDSTIFLFNQLFGPLETNPHVHRAILMGELGVAKMALRCLSAAGECSFLNNKLARRLGFFSEEVRELYKVYDLSDVEKQKLAKRLYGGYLTLTTKQEGDEEPMSVNLHSYHPLSIIRFLNSGFVGNAYAQNHPMMKGLTSLFRRPAINSLLTRLLAGEDIDVGCEEDLQIDEIELMELKRAAVELPDDVSKLLANYFLKLLHHFGYLAAREYVDENSGTRSLRLRIPNWEMWRLLYPKSKKAFVMQYNFSPDALEAAAQKFIAMAGEMQSEDISELKEAYRALITNLRPVSVHQNGPTPGQETNEDMHHSVMNYVALQAKFFQFGTEMYFFKRTPEESKPDIVVVNLHNNMGIVIEMKHASSLSRTTAAEQIERYKKVFRDRRDVTRVKLIAFNVHYDRTSAEVNKWTVETTCEYINN